MADLIVSPNRKRRQDLEDAKKDSDSPEGHPTVGNVLLLTILEALYPINTKLLEVREILFHHFIEDTVH